MEKDPTDNMTLLSETKGKDIKEPKEKIVAVPEPSETNKEREPLPLPSLHKAANPYRPPIPLEYRPTKGDNNDKPLKMKDLDSVKVNITIGGREDASYARSWGEHQYYALLCLPKTRVG